MRFLPGSALSALYRKGLHRELFEKGNYEVATQILMFGESVKPVAGDLDQFWDKIDWSLVRRLFRERLESGLEPCSPSFIYAVWNVINEKIAGVGLLQQFVDLLSMIPSTGGEWRRSFFLNREVDSGFVLNTTLIALTLVGRSDVAFKLLGALEKTIMEFPEKAGDFATRYLFYFPINGFVYRVLGRVDPKSLGWVEIKSYVESKAPVLLEERKKELEDDYIPSYDFSGLTDPLLFLAIVFSIKDSGYISLPRVWTDERRWKIYVFSRMGERFKDSQSIHTAKSIFRACIAEAKRRGIFKTEPLPHFQLDPFIYKNRKRYNVFKVVGEITRFSDGFTHKNIWSLANNLIYFLSNYVVYNERPELNVLVSPSFDLQDSLRIYRDGNMVKAEVSYSKNVKLGKTALNIHVSLYREIDDLFEFFDKHRNQKMEAEAKRLAEIVEKKLARYLEDRRESMKERKWDIPSLTARVDGNAVEINGVFNVSGIKLRMSFKKIYKDLETKIDDILAEIDRVIGVDKSFESLESKLWEALVSSENFIYIEKNREKIMFELALDVPISVIGYLKSVLNKLRRNGIRYRSKCDGSCDVRVYFDAENVVPLFKALGAGAEGKRLSVFASLVANSEWYEPLFRAFKEGLGVVPATLYAVLKIKDVKSEEVLDFVEKHFGELASALRQNGVVFKSYYYESMPEKFFEKMARKNARDALIVASNLFKRADPDVFKKVFGFNPLEGVDTIDDIHFDAGVIRFSSRNYKISWNVYTGDVVFAKTSDKNKDYLILRGVGKSVEELSEKVSLFLEKSREVEEKIERFIDDLSQSLGVRLEKIHFTPQAYSFDHGNKTYNVLVKVDEERVKVVVGEYAGIVLLKRKSYEATLENIKTLTNRIARDIVVKQPIII